MPSAGVLRVVGGRGARLPADPRLLQVQEAVLAAQRLLPGLLRHSFGSSSALVVIVPHAGFIALCAGRVRMGRHVTGWR